MSQDKTLPALPEPQDYLFQNEDTGNIMTVDGQQVKWGFEENNPRWKRLGGSFSEAQMHAHGERCVAAHLERTGQSVTNDAEQSAFESWLERACPSGDVEQVQRQWEASSEYYDLHAVTPPEAATAEAADDGDHILPGTPTRIYLDLGFDPAHYPETVFRDVEEMTWSADNATGHGIPYVLDVAGKAPASVPRSTGYLAPKDRYVVPALFNPYTGEPRDVRDVQSDPQGTLIVPPGAALAAQPRSAT